MPFGGNDSAHGQAPAVLCIESHMVSASSSPIFLKNIKCSMCLDKTDLKEKESEWKIVTKATCDGFG